MCAKLPGIELLPSRAGSCGVPAPGWDLGLLDESGQEAAAGEEGAIGVKAPLPPSAFATVWRDHEGFQQSYWSQFLGFYLTGEDVYQDAEGYVYVMGRTDDVINDAIDWAH